MWGRQWSLAVRPQSAARSRSIRPMTGTDAIQTVEQAQAAAARFNSDYAAVRAQIARVIVGHDAIIDGVLTCLFVGGHCLLEARGHDRKFLLILSGDVTLLVFRDDARLGLHSDLVGRVADD